MKIKLKILSMFFILLAGLSCSYLLKGKLVGTWKNQDTKEIWDFKPDGKLEIREEFDPQDPKIIAKGTYETIDSGNVELDLTYYLFGKEPESVNETVKYEFREDRLYIKPQGREYVFKKFESPSSVKTIKETKTDAEIVKYRLDKLIEYCSQGDIPTARRYLRDSIAGCTDLQHLVKNGDTPKVSDKPEKCVFIKEDGCIAYRVSHTDGFEELYEFKKYNDEWVLDEQSTPETKNSP